MGFITGCPLVPPDRWSEGDGDFNELMSKRTPRVNGRQHSNCDHWLIKRDGGQTCPLHGMACCDPETCPDWTKKRGPADCDKCEHENGYHPPLFGCLKHELSESGANKEGNCPDFKRHKGLWQWLRHHFNRDPGCGATGMG